MAVEVLDGRFVSPGDFVDGDAEDGGDFLALGGAGRPAAEGDGGDAAVVEAAALGELGDADVAVRWQRSATVWVMASARSRSSTPAKCRIRRLGNGVARFGEARSNSLLAGVLKLYRILAVSIIPIDGI